MREMPFLLRKALFMVGAVALIALQLLELALHATATWAGVMARFSTGGPGSPWEYASYVHAVVVLASWALIGQFRNAAWP